MLKPRDGYSFEDFQYEGEKIISQRKRVPITSNKLSDKEVEEIYDVLWSRYRKYSVFKSDISQVIYLAEHPCGSFYHEGRIAFGTGVTISGKGLLSWVSMHQTTISTKQENEVSIPYCILDSEIGSSMLFLEPESAIVNSHIGCSTILNGANFIHSTSLGLVTLKGNNYLSGSDIQNFFVVNSRINDVSLKDFTEPLILVDADIRDDKDIVEICRYNLETKRKEGGILYRAKNNDVALSTPEHGVKILNPASYSEKLSFYIKKLHAKDARKQKELTSACQQFIDKMYAVSQ